MVLKLLSELQNDQVLVLFFLNLAMLTESSELDVGVTN